MKRYISVIMILMMLLAAGCSNGQVQTSEEPQTTMEEKIVKVAVSIPPQKAIVEAIAGDMVEVVTMIPPGYSPANYAPTQKEMAALSDSKLYFAIDVPTEAVNIMPMIESGDYNLKIVDLADIVDDVHAPRFFEETGHAIDEHDHAHEEHADEDHDHEEHADEGHDHEEHADEDHDHEEHADEDHDHEEHADEEHAHEEHADEEHADDGHEGHNHAGRDPHIWVSTKRIEVMAKTMAEELSALMPEQKATFDQNLSVFLADLSAVDNELKASFADHADMPFLIYHPSLGYFADDYDLHMIALESEGKAATVQGMAEVIDFAKDNGIQTVFYQSEFDSKQAELLASEIGGQAVQLNPLSENVIENLKEMGNSIRNSMK